MKKILALDLGITSLGYSILEEVGEHSYRVLDNAVMMRDAPFDTKSGESSQSQRRVQKSMRTLIEKRKRRIKEVARIFDEFGLLNFDTCMKIQKENKIIDKWKLRAEDALQRPISYEELFAVLAHMAKHRGYKSIATNDLLYELELELGLIEPADENESKVDEKRQVYAALSRVDALKKLYPAETIAQVIHRAVQEGKLNTYRNHDNYEKMIRREDIEHEIETIVIKQCELGAINLNSEKCKEFIDALHEAITDQVMPENDPELFGKCSCYPEEIAAPRYSYLFDLYRLYKIIGDLKINGNALDEDQKEQLVNYVEERIANGKSLKSLTYKEVRKILSLQQDQKIYGKEDEIIIKGKKRQRDLIKFFFISKIGKFSNLIAAVIKHPERLTLFAKISEALQLHKTPQESYKAIDTILKKHGIPAQPNEMVALINGFEAGTQNISHKFIIDALPHLIEGKREDEVKEILGIQTSENYGSYPKSLQFLHLGKDNLFEKYVRPDINNHAVKSLASWSLRRISDLSWRNGPFDEIVIESTRDALPKSIKTKIEKAINDREKELEKIIKNYKVEFPSIDRKMARKIKLWESQKFLDIYTGKSINISDLFEGRADIEHIVPRSLGGLSAEYNLVISHRDANMQKSNRLPMDWLGEDQAYINRVEMLFNEHKISWKKRKNLLAKSYDEIYNEVQDRKSLRATSYLEALVAQNLKMFYPFPNKEHRRTGVAVRNVPGKTTSKARQILGIKSKSRDTNWHHAEDATILATLSRGWQNRLHRMLKQNYGKSEAELQKIWKEFTPHLEGMPIADYIKESFERFVSFGEESLWYRDMFGSIRSVSYWVSRKPLSASSHKDTIYSGKHAVPTLRKSILAEFQNLNVIKDRHKLTPEGFMKKYEKEIRAKLWLHHIDNNNDPVMRAIDQRAREIASILEHYALHDTQKDKEIDEMFKETLNATLTAPIVVDGKTVRKTRFVYNKLNAIAIDRGLVETDKNMLGIFLSKGAKKLEITRMDVNNVHKKEDAMKVYLNEMIYLYNNKKLLHAGCLRSYLQNAQGAKMIALFNPRFPAKPTSQPKLFSTGSQIKQVSVGSATGIIKVHLDLNGKVKSYEKFGLIPKELEEAFKQECGYGSLEDNTHH